MGRVGALGVVEHSYLSGIPERSTIYAISLVDPDRRIVIHVFDGRRAAELGLAGSRPLRQGRRLIACRSAEDPAAPAAWPQLLRVTLSPGRP